MVRDKWLTVAAVSAKAPQRKVRLGNLVRCFDRKGAEARAVQPR
jgi:hypothetical protein